MNDCINTAEGAVNADEYRLFLVNEHKSEALFTNGLAGALNVEGWTNKRSGDADYITVERPFHVVRLRYEAEFESVNKRTVVRDVFKQEMVRLKGRGVSIRVQCTMREFIESVEEAGGEVYSPTSININ